MNVTKYTRAGNNGRWFNITYSWGGGDTLDRERVRDIILEQPQFSWSS